MGDIMRLIAVAALIILFLPVGATAGAEQFPTEAATKAHCPKDIVVLLNIPSGVYHFAGERWYGKTKNGAYVCRGEADAEGDRITKNGQ